MKIFSNSYSKHLASKVASKIGVDVSLVEKKAFPDNEQRIRILDTVSGEEVVIIASTGSHPDEFYMELFFIIDAVRRGGASKLTLVIPYLAYQRQDHIFRDGESVSLDVIISTLERLGVDKFVTFDLHSIKIPELFSVQVSHLSALPLFAQEIKKIGLENSFLVSPDLGGIRRIKILSEMLSNLPIAEITKNRDLESGEISSTQISGAMGDRAFIVDDVISTGRTISASVNLLREKGVSDIYVFATHSVFSNNASEILSKSNIHKIFVTDSIEMTMDKKIENLEVLSISDLIVSEIQK